MTADATVLPFQAPELPDAKKTKRQKPTSRAKTINAERLTEDRRGTIASRADVEKAAEEMPEEFMICRDSATGHDWQWHDAIDYGRELEREFKCRTCGCIKFQVLDNFGDIIRQGRKYVDGFLLTGIGRVGKDSSGVFRLATTRKHARKAVADGA